MDKKLLFLVNDSYTVLTFRKELILFLQSKGYSIEIIGGDSDKKDEIEQLGVKYNSISFNNRSLSIFSNINYFIKLRKIIRSISPDLIFTFQAKPNTIGILASSILKKVKIISMVEGLGDPFQPSSFKGRVIMRIVSLLYKISFKKSNFVFFLNNDDRNYFLNKKLCNAEQSAVIHGIGISINDFPFLEYKSNKNVIMLSRLVKNKGILEYCEIAKKVRNVRNDITFYLAGKESDIKYLDIKKYCDESDIVYLGLVDNPKELIEGSTILALPSFYREGLPRSILESMSLGRLVIAYKNVGVNDIVLDEVNGFLIEAHDINSFSKKIIDVFEGRVDYKTITINARRDIEKKYNSDIINSIIFDKIEEILKYGK